MASITKGMNLQGISPKSIVLTMLVGLLVLGLFFIPEIIDFQRTITHFGSGTPSVSAPYPVTDSSPSEVLKDISNLIDSGYIDQLKAKKVVGTTAPPSKGFLVKARGNEVVPSAPQLSWSEVQTRESSAALRAAQRDAFALLKDLDAGKSASRYALYTFIAAVDMLLISKERNMSAEDAVRYLEYAHVAVTNALQRDGIERGEINRWLAMDLGPVIKKRDGVVMQRNQLPFDPQLSLVWVKMRQQTGRRGEWKEDSPAYLSLRGYVVGKDVRNIEISRDGQVVSTVTPKAPNASGLRIFSVQMNARGIYLFRVKSISGQEYEKVYDFYSRARKFPWRRGTFQIPFFGESSRRLDRFFTRRSGRILGASSFSDFAPGAEFTHF